jgi:hypothetical protein
MELIVDFGGGLVYQASGRASALRAVPGADQTQFFCGSYKTLTSADHDAGRSQLDELIV